MATIYLIRHGQASFGQENYDQLSELGEQQAVRLGQNLAQRLPHFDQIHLGAMLRHRQTAQGCLLAKGESWQQDQWHVNADWNEYDHRDILAQMGEQFTSAASTQAWVKNQASPKAAFEQLFNDAMQRWMSGDYHDYVESWQDYFDRVQAGLQDVIEQSRDAENVAVFTSGGPISLICQQLLGIPSDNLMRLNWTLVNAGISKIVAGKNRTFCASLNEHTAFEGEHQHMVTYR